MSDWNARANDIFLRAAELSDPEERSRYVSECCQDDASLRESVDELLSASESAGDFLERPLSHLPHEIMQTAPQLVPEQVGRYKIFEELGEGGMGVVYRAEQQTPVRRQVALKIIKPGLDTRQIIARFEAERQVLAMMEHPGIARVLDAGATEAGRPYFVMELVSGVPVTTFCNDQKLSRSQRLALFIEVCHAVQHAHQKGVIHRDLKPSNILVTRQDERAAVKVIDFGVAKAIGQHATESTLTGVAQWVGTPLYMSPEQASPVPIDIDTRSDVYSLGVLLYELLTDTTPFDAETLGRTDELEKRRLIREYDPPYPSARVTSLDSGARARLAGGERIETRKLSRQLRGELDWIVMKSLEKDRERRYESVGALAADIGRYLNDEPVAAGPPSQLYRLQKLAWRNRGALTTGLVVAMALVIGTAAAIWQAIEATKAFSLAEKRTLETHSALEQAEAANRAADLQLKRAQDSELESKRLLYASEMRLAVDAWQDNDVRRMQEILERHIPEDGEVDQRGFEWHFLSCLSGVPSRELLAGPPPLYCVRVSPDGKVVAAAGAESRIHLFDAALNPTISLPSNQIEVNALEFTPDGATLFSGGDDGSVAQWNVTTGDQIHRFKAHDDAVFGIALVLSRNALVTGGRDSLLKVWDPATFTLRETISFHNNTIQSLVASKEGIVAAGSDDFRVSTWDLSGSMPAWAEADQPLARVNTVAFSSEGEFIATGHVSGLLSIRHTENGNSLGLQMFPDALHSLAFAPQPRADTGTRWVAVGDRAGTVYLLPSGAFVQHSGLLPRSFFDRSRQWQAHKGKLYSMAFMPDGSRLLTAGEDGKLKAWDYEASSHVRRLPFDVKDFAVVSPDQVATASDTVRVTSLSTGTQLTKLPGTRYGGRRMRFAAASDQILFKDSADAIFALPAKQSTPRLIYRPPTETGIGYFAVTPGGHRLAVQLMKSDGDETVGIGFPLETHLPTIPCSSGVRQLRFAPDGSIVFDQLNELRFVRPENGQRVHTLSGHLTTIADFDFSPDGTTVATASSDRTVRVWDWKTETELWKATAHENEASTVAYSPDGETVATAGTDGVLRLWRWRHNTLVLEYRLLDWPVSKIAFTGDGTKLLVMADGGLRIYDATHGRPPGNPEATPAAAANINQ